MTRIDKLDEIMESYERRKYDPGYVLSEEDIKKIHRHLIKDDDLFMQKRKPPCLFYIACMHDKLEDIFFVSFIDGPEFSEDCLEDALTSIKRKGLDFKGIVYYTADRFPAKYIDEHNLRQKKCVPDGVEKPDLFLATDYDGNYVKISRDLVTFDVT